LLDQSDKASVHAKRREEDAAAAAAAGGMQQSSHDEANHMASLEGHHQSLGVEVGRECPPPEGRLSVSQTPTEEDNHGDRESPSDLDVLISMRKRGGDDDQKCSDSHADTEEEKSHQHDDDEEGLDNSDGSGGENRSEGMNQSLVPDAISEREEGMEVDHQVQLQQQEEGEQNAPISPPTRTKASSFSSGEEEQQLDDHHPSTPPNQDGIIVSGATAMDVSEGNTERTSTAHSMAAEAVVGDMEVDAQGGTTSAVPSLPPPPSMPSTEADGAAQHEDEEAHLESLPPEPPKSSTNDTMQAPATLNSSMDEDVHDSPQLPEAMITEDHHAESGDGEERALSSLKEPGGAVLAPTTAHQESEEGDGSFSIPQAPKPTGPMDEAAPALDDSGEKPSRDAQPPVVEHATTQGAQGDGSMGQEDNEGEEAEDEEEEDEKQDNPINVFADIQPPAFSQFSGTQPSQQWRSQRSTQGSTQGGPFTMPSQFLPSVPSFPSAGASVSRPMEDPEQLDDDADPGPPAFLLQPLVNEEKGCEENVPAAGGGGGGGCTDERSAGNITPPQPNGAAAEDLPSSHHPTENAAVVAPQQPEELKGTEVKDSVDGGEEKESQISGGGQVGKSKVNDKDLPNGEHEVDGVEHISANGDQGDDEQSPAQEEVGVDEKQESVVPPSTHGSDLSGPSSMTEMAVGVEAKSPSRNDKENDVMEVDEGQEAVEPPPSPTCQGDVNDSANAHGLSVDMDIEAEPPGHHEEEERPMESSREKASDGGDVLKESNENVQGVIQAGAVIAPPVKDTTQIATPDGQPDERSSPHIDSDPSEGRASQEEAKSENPPASPAVPDDEGKAASPSSKPIGAINRRAAPDPEETVDEPSPREQSRHVLQKHRLDRSISVTSTDAANALLGLKDTGVGRGGEDNAEESVSNASMKEQSDHDELDGESMGSLDRKVPNEGGYWKSASLANAKPYSEKKSSPASNGQASGPMEEKLSGSVTEDEDEGEQQAEEKSKESNISRAAGSSSETHDSSSHQPSNDRSPCLLGSSAMHYSSSQEELPPSTATSAHNTASGNSSSNNHSSFFHMASINRYSDTRIPAGVDLLAESEKEFSSSDAKKKTAKAPPPPPAQPSKWINKKKHTPVEDPLLPMALAAAAVKKPPVNEDGKGGGDNAEDDYDNEEEQVEERPLITASHKSSKRSPSSDSVEKSCECLLFIPYLVLAHEQYTNPSFAVVPFPDDRQEHQDLLVSSKKSHSSRSHSSDGGRGDLSSRKRRRRIRTVESDEEEGDGDEADMSIMEQKRSAPKEVDPHADEAELLPEGVDDEEEEPPPPSSPPPEPDDDNLEAMAEVMPSDAPQRIFLDQLLRKDQELKDKEKRLQEWEDRLRKMTIPSSSASSLPAKHASLPASTTPHVSKAAAASGGGGGGGGGSGGKSNQAKELRHVETAQQQRKPPPRVSSPPMMQNEEASPQLPPPERIARKATAASGGKSIQAKELRNVDAGPQQQQQQQQQEPPPRVSSPPMLQEEESPPPPPPPVNHLPKSPQAATRATRPISTEKKRYANPPVNRAPHKPSPHEKRTHKPARSTPYLPRLTSPLKRKTKSLQHERAQGGRTPPKTTTTTTTASSSKQGHSETDDRPKGVFDFDSQADREVEYVSPYKLKASARGGGLGGGQTVADAMHTSTSKGGEEREVSPKWSGVGPGVLKKVVKAKEGGGGMDKTEVITPVPKEHQKTTLTSDNSKKSGQGGGSSTSHHAAKKVVTISSPANYEAKSSGKKTPVRELKFNDLWRYLKDNGWTWQTGRGLISW